MLHIIELRSIDTPDLQNTPFVFISVTVVAQRTPSLFDTRSDVLEATQGPMRRDLAQPLDAGFLQGDVRVEALGDRPRNEGGALLLEQLDQPLLLRHQPIDPRRLPIKEGDDGALLNDLWVLNRDPVHVTLGELVSRRSVDEGSVVDAIQCV